jgi:hypothetical protein
MTHRFLAALACLWLAGPAHSAEPAASLRAFRLHYVSAFAGQPAAADPKPVDWRDSNALVGKLQGHDGHWRAPAQRARP